MYNNLENVLIMIVLFILPFGQVLTYLCMYDFFFPFWVLVSGLRVFQGVSVVQDGIRIFEREGELVHLSYINLWRSL